MSPGSLPLSTELYQEGIIIPPIKLIYSGWINESALALITANSRAPEERLGDLEAQLAAHRVGENRLRDLMVEHGVEVLRGTRRRPAGLFAAHDRSRDRQHPRWRYRFEDALEGDGQSEFRIPIKVAHHGQG